MRLVMEIYGCISQRVHSEHVDLIHHVHVFPDLTKSFNDCPGILFKVATPLNTQSCSPGEDPSTGFQSGTSSKCFTIQATIVSGALLVYP